MRERKIRKEREYRKGKENSTHNFLEYFSFFMYWSKIEGGYSFNAILF